MTNAMLSLRVIGEDGATRSRVAREGHTSSSPDYRVIEDAPSSHKPSSNLGNYA